jgi:hypothetical protein
MEIEQVEEQKSNPIQLPQVREEDEAEPEINLKGRHTRILGTLSKKQGKDFINQMVD